MTLVAGPLQHFRVPLRPDSRASEQAPAAGHFDPAAQGCPAPCVRYECAFSLRGFLARLRDLAHRVASADCEVCPGPLVDGSGSLASEGPTTDHAATTYPYAPDWLAAVAGLLAKVAGHPDNLKTVAGGQLRAA